MATEDCCTLSDVLPFTTMLAGRPIPSTLPLDNAFGRELVAGIATCQTP